MFRPVAFALTAGLVATSGYAQDKTAEVDRIFNWVKPGMPGCVAAASQDGKLMVNRAYGLADPDTFQRGAQTVRFRRDQAGKVIALDLMNPALRKITFTRLSDR